MQCNSPLMYAYTQGWKRASHIYALYVYMSNMIQIVHKHWGITLLQTNLWQYTWVSMGYWCVHSHELLEQLGQPFKQFVAAYIQPAIQFIWCRNTHIWCSYRLPFNTETRWEHFISLDIYISLLRIEGRKSYMIKVGMFTCQIWLGWYINTGT